MHRLLVIIVWLLLAMVAAWSALWIRSYRKSDRIWFCSPHGVTLAYTCRGGIVLLTQPDVTQCPWRWERFEFGHEPEPFEAAFGSGECTWFGIRRGSYFTSMAHNAYAIAIPMWLFVAACTLPAAAILLLARGTKLIARRRGRGFEPVIRAADASALSPAVKSGESPA
ncbi:MAG: hypothetical protein ABSH20_28385 [Tepidisphaeraceae bacterium]|jgi:hypothetical protein